EPGVVRTPASGLALTHRVGLHLGAGFDPNVSPVAGLAMTPRAQAEPALNAWLAGVLPPLDTVGCKVTFRDAPTLTHVDRMVSLRDLGMQPLDLLYLVSDASYQAMAELDDRVVRHVVDTLGPRPDGGVLVRYLERIGPGLTVFEVLPLLRCLRRLALHSR